MAKTRRGAVVGSMIGGAIGDALGYPVEFMSYSEIIDKYGELGITKYELDQDTGKALISDDTQMTLFTADGILSGDTRFCMRGLASFPRMMSMAYRCWYQTQTNMYKPSNRNLSWLLDVPELYARRAPGMTCLDALGNGASNNSKGCGGVMRVAPIGLRFTDYGTEWVTKNAADAAEITHKNSLGYMPAGVFACIVYLAAHHSDEYTSLDEIVVESLKVAQDVFNGDKHLHEMCKLVKCAIELSCNNESDINNIRRLGEGWVGEEALAISVYCALRYQNDFSAGIIASVNHSGDSDSTGSITGNILGAFLGFDAIAPKWFENLELIMTINEIALDLSNDCPNGEYIGIVDKKWHKKYCEHTKA